MSINEIKERVKKFLRETLEVKEIGEDVRVVGVDHAGEGWVVDVEVVERNLALPGHWVFEKEHYIVKLTSDLEVTSYRQVKNGREEEE